MSVSKVDELCEFLIMFTVALFVSLIEKDKKINRIHEYFWSDDDC